MRRWRTRVVLVGVTAYEHAGQHAPKQVERDLAEVASVLTDPRVGVAERLRCRVLKGGKARAADVLAAVRKRRWRPQDDLLIFYYSGHGRLRDEKLWLSTFDSDLSAPAPGLEYRRLAEELRRRSRARRVVVILDCCYSGNALVDVPDEPGYYVLTSVQKYRRTPQPEASRLSPYTETLVEVLRHGDPDSHDGLAVGHLADLMTARFSDRYIDQGALTVEVAEEELDEGEREALRWRPRHSITDGSAIISRPAGRPEPARPGPLIRLAQWTAVRVPEYAATIWSALAETARNQRRPLAAAGAVLLLAVVGVVIRVVWPSSATCLPPIELRVQATTENEPTIAKAADGFERSPLDHRSLGKGDPNSASCRRVNVSVSAAPMNQEVSAFAAADAWQRGSVGDDGACAAGPPDDVTTLVSACPAPLRDVGPQPDVTITDSAAELALFEQALGPSRPYLSDRGSLATSPLVIGLPATTADAITASLGPDAPWQSLLPALTQQHLSLLRPTPTTSATGLSQTMGLYLGWNGTIGTTPTIPPSDATQVEQSFSTAGVPATDTSTLLCAPTRQGVALVSAKALAQPDCPNDAPTGLVPYRPRGLPELDLHYVTVTWPGAHDGTVRRAAAERLRTYLTGDAGRELLRQEGYGPASQASDDSSPLDQVHATLGMYHKANQPVRVLFVLDLSSSMADNGKLAAAVSAMDTAIGSLHSSDSYGIWTMPRAADHQQETAELLPIGSHDAATGQRAISGIGVVPNGSAAFYQAVDQGIGALQAGPGQEPRVLVVLTDGDDPEADPNPDASWKSSIGQLVRNHDVILDVVGMDSAVCDAGSSITTLAGVTGACTPGASKGGLGQQVAGLLGRAREGATG